MGATKTALSVTGSSDRDGNRAAQTGDTRRYLRLGFLSAKGANGTGIVVKTSALELPGSIPIEALFTRDRCGVQLLGYCLMTNHVHLIVIPETEQSLAKAIGRTHYLYTRYVNHCRQRSGHLWQNRCFSTVLDRDHLVVALRYVDLNPVRAGLAGRAGDYPWSSAAAHVTGSDSSSLLDMATWRKICPLGDWHEALDAPQQAGDISRLRESTHSGRPCAGEAFVEDLERRLGRRLKPRQGGRPPSSDRDSHRVFGAAAGQPAKS